MSIAVRQSSSRDGVVDRTSPRQVLLAPVLVGAFGAMLTFAFSWVPSLWYDEGATVSAATRTVPQLIQLVGRVDLVHGLYYLSMDVWFDLVGYSPVTLRLPSALATGVAAALVVVLVRRIGTGRLAVIAGVLFCLLPRVTWMGTEGRSYAVTAMLAVLLTLAFLAASRRSGRERSVRVRWWALYAALAVLSIVTFIYLALLVVAHGVSAIVQWRTSRARDHRPLTGWFGATLAAGIVTLPFVVFTMREAGQVDWIRPIGVATWRQVFVSQWFPDNVPFAVAAWVLVVLAVVMLWRRRSSSSSRALLTFILPWLVVPTLGLVAATLFVTPLYSPRYVTFSTPAVAILMAAALDAIGRRRLAVVAIVACAALTVPSYIRQRQPEAKDHTAWSQVAGLVAGQRAIEPPGTTGAVIWGPLRRHPDATDRMIEQAYPSAFAGLVDADLAVSGADRGGLWATNTPIDQVGYRLGGIHQVWLITSTEPGWRTRAATELSDLGYVVAQQWTFRGTKVTLFGR